MTNKPNNVTSLIKKRDLKKAKEILYKEFELIGLSDNDPDYDSIYAHVRGGFFRTLEENAHIKYPEGKYTVYGTDENGNDYFEILDEEDLGWLEDNE
jgi:hypothetical protein